MDAKDLVREGRLNDALAALQNEVRAQPADAKQRIFLFQLLAVMGQWDRALNQLNVAGELDPGALAMMHTYRDALSCEVLRNEVMAGERTPLLFGEPQQWLALHMEASRLSAAGNFAAAQELRAKAYEDAPATSGEIDGESFEWLADADSRLGPVIEMVVNGNYYWVPTQNLGEVNFDPVADLRDLVWRPAYITWANGGEIVALVPGRYAGSDTSDDDKVKLGRTTVWEDKGNEEFHGLGQRLLTTDAGDYPLLSVTQIKFNTAPAEEDTEAG